MITHEDLFDFVQVLELINGLRIVILIVVIMLNEDSDLSLRLLMIIDIQIVHLIFVLFFFDEWMDFFHIV